MRQTLAVLCNVERTIYFRLKSFLQRLETPKKKKNHTNEHKGYLKIAYLFLWIHRNYGVDWVTNDEP